MNTTYFLDLVAGNVFRTKEVPPIPSSFYVGLSSTEPNLDGTGVTEPPASAGYARVELTVMSEPTSGAITNDQSIDFDESTADWGTMSHYTIFDSQEEGNLLMFGNLSAVRTVEKDTIMTLKPGSLNLSIVNPTPTSNVG